MQELIPGSSQQDLIPGQLVQELIPGPSLQDPSLVSHCHDCVQDWTKQDGGQLYQQRQALKNLCFTNLLVDEFININIAWRGRHHLLVKNDKNLC